MQLGLGFCCSGLAAGVLPYWPLCEAGGRVITVELGSVRALPDFIYVLSCLTSSEFH